MAANYVITRDSFYTRWLNRDRKPVLHIKSRDRPEEIYFGTTGNSPDLMEAARLAARHMIEHLRRKYDLSRTEAFALCGLAADLRLHQVVNPPNWTVGLMMPNSIFGGQA